MAFCSKCGNQVNEGVKFCGKCGTSMADQTPLQQSNIQPQNNQQPVLQRGVSPSNKTTLQKTKIGLIIGFALCIIIFLFFDVVWGLIGIGLEIIYLVCVLVITNNEKKQNRNGG